MAMAVAITRERWERSSPVLNRARRTAPTSEPVRQSIKSRLRESVNTLGCRHSKSAPRRDRWPVTATRVTPACTHRRWRGARQRNRCRKKSIQSWSSSGSSARSRMRIEPGATLAAAACSTSCEKTRKTSAASWESTMCVSSTNTSAQSATSNSASSARQLCRR